MIPRVRQVGALDGAVAVLLDEDVVGLHVAVDAAAAVHVRQRLADVLHDESALVRRQRAEHAGRQRRQQWEHKRTVHGHVGDAMGLVAPAEHGDDGRVVEEGHRVDLVLERPQVLRGVLLAGAAESLDGDGRAIR
jgi:hypothetical protein